jgi:hypothetical protein
MSKTLTIRLADAQDDALTRRAQALGRTRSDLVRELIERGLEEQPIGRRIGHLSGRLKLARPKAGWRKRLRERNWR